MKVSVLLTLLWLGITSTNAQDNYVLNPSFEIHDTCPNAISEIRYAKYWNALDTNLYTQVNDSLWYSALGAAEYYHACAPWWSGVSVPQTTYYYHYARSGDGMSGFYTYLYAAFQGPAYRRDYVHGHLTQSLTPGQSYCVSFYVASPSLNVFAVNHLAAYLDDGSIQIGQDSMSSAQPQTQVTPQVITNTILSDTIHWMKVEGSFVATGNESRITIGNFGTDAQTSVIAMADTTGVWNSGQGAWGYYLLDDISVVPSDLPAYAGVDTAINEGDSVFIGRDEILPDIKWYANNVLLDSVNAGIWVKPNQTTTYVLEQSLCGNLKFDSVTVIVNVDTAIDTTEGVGYISYNKGFTIYPNPSGAEFNIHCPAMANKLVNVSVSDISGRRIMEEQLLFERSDKLISLHAVPGVYLIELTTGNSIKYVQKLIIK